MDLLVNAAVFFIGLLAVFGLVYWADRARTDRSASVGLYLLFGIPAVLVLVFGAAAVWSFRSLGTLLLCLALALGLPLLKPVRALLARVTPMDPDSPIDMVGLCILLTVAVVSVFSFAAGPVEVGAVSLSYLVLSVVAQAGFAYVAVGWLNYRGGRQATSRLGLTWPTWRTVPIALGFVVLGLMANALTSLLTFFFQPSLFNEITDVTTELTSEVQNPLGAIVLGLSAGIGEELLLRGAVQPRFGLVLTSLVFALLHTQYGVSFVILGLFGIGMLLGLERKYFGTTAAIITHATFNAVVVLAQIYG